jgi:hypothetical protein
MSKDSGRGTHGAKGRNRAAAAMEDTDPMTREDILEAFGHSGPDPSTSGRRRGHDRGAPAADTDTEPRQRS